MNPHREAKDVNEEPERIQVDLGEGSPPEGYTKDELEKNWRKVRERLLRAVDAKTEAEKSRAVLENWILKQLPPDQKLAVARELVKLGIRGGPAEQEVNQHAQEEILERTERLEELWGMV